MISLLSIIFFKSRETGDVPEDGRRASVVPIFKKGKKEEPGNYRPVSLTSIPGKILEQIVQPPRKQGSNYQKPTQSCQEQILPN